MNGVAIKLSAEGHRLVSELHDSPQAAAIRHRPCVAIRRFPVCRQSGLPSDVPALLEVVVDEILQEELINIRTAARARNRPHIVGQNS